MFLFHFQVLCDEDRDKSFRESYLGKLEKNSWSVTKKRKGFYVANSKDFCPFFIYNLTQKKCSCMLRMVFLLVSDIYTTSCHGIQIFTPILLQKERSKSFFLPVIVSQSATILVNILLRKPILALQRNQKDSCRTIKVRFAFKRLLPPTLIGNSSLLFPIILHFFHQKIYWK